MSISAEQHVHVLAAAQRNVDNSVSKTCNGAVNDTIESVDELYHLARQLGCKAVSYYRDGSRENQVLNTMKKSEPPALAVGQSAGQEMAGSSGSTPMPSQAFNPSSTGERVERPRELPGST